MEMLVIALVALGAFAAVLVPLFRRRPGTGDEDEFENVPPARPATGAEPATDAEPATGERVNVRPHGTDEEIETELRLYRDALRAGTVCRKCGQANPPSSRYCHECGARLAAADAKEFE